MAGTGLSASASAEAGYVLAQEAVAELYENGPGVQNLDEAVRWYRKASETYGPAMAACGSSAAGEVRPTGGGRGPAVQSLSAGPYQYSPNKS